MEHWTQILNRFSEMSSELEFSREKKVSHPIEHVMINNRLITFAVASCWPKESRKKVLFLVVRPLRGGGEDKGPTTKEKGTFFFLIFDFVVWKIVLIRIWQISVNLQPKMEKTVLFWIHNFNICTKMFFRQTKCSSALCVWFCLYCVICTESLLCTIEWLLKLFRVFKGEKKVGRSQKW